MEPQITPITQMDLVMTQQIAPTARSTTLRQAGACLSAAEVSVASVCLQEICVICVICG